MRDSILLLSSASLPFAHSFHPGSAISLSELYPLTVEVLSLVYSSTIRPSLIFTMRSAP